MASTPLSFYEARMAHERLLIPSLEFPLTSATLSKGECRHILQPGLKECLQKAGFASTTSRAVVFGPKSLGGAAFTSLYAAQSTNQITTLVHHLRENKEAADLIRINLGWTQLVSGAKNPILSDCTTPLPHMTKNWVLSIREALAGCNGRIEIDNAPVFPTLRARDEHIMERAVQFDVRRPGDLLSINHCRLFCGVITLADACTADGRRLARPVYECSVRNFRGSKLFWPCLPPPTEKQKNIWRAFLAQTYLMRMPSAIETKGRATPNRLDLQLAQELGEWTASPLTRQRFDEIVSRGRRLFRRDTGFSETQGPVVEDGSIPTPFYAWERYDGRKKKDARWPPLPSNKVIWNDIAWKGFPVPNPGTDTMKSAERESWMREYICNVQEASKDAMESISNHNAFVACSDGGADTRKGSFGWVLKVKGTN